MIELDEIDTSIIELLKKDGRMSYRSIADKIGKTEATVRRRVNKLLESKFIKKFTLVLDENMIPKTKATIKIKPDLKKIDEICSKLADIDEISDVLRLSGDCGILIILEIPSINDFDSIIDNKIAVIDGVELNDVCFITKEVKTKY